MTTSRALALAMITIACGGPEAHDDAAALQADSSAAGYAVGVPRDTNANATRRLPAPPGSLTVRDTLATSGSRASGGTTPVAADSGAPTSRVVQPADSATKSTERAIAPRDTVRPILIARVRVNEYLEYNSASRTAYIDIVATRAPETDSSTTASDTLAFNHSRSGNLTISVPLGWQVVGQFVNRDPVNRHSAIVIEEAYPLPTVLPAAAFPQALTRRVDDGLATNVREEISFTAGREGRFLIVCGVAGHAEAGQRMQLIVTSDIHVPAYGR